MFSVLWISGFVLGVSMFTPISSYNLCIDYYDLVFPGQQLAVKTTVCYEMAFVALQVLCHLADAKLPISRAARIQIRHVCVALIMAFIIVWERVIVGDVHHPNPAALPILLAVVTITGAFDGICVGAVFGEAAVLGPASAHALVAGTAGVMPLLAVLRIIFKAALPATTEGLVLSVALYFAAAAAVLLAGLAVYSFVVMPAVAAAVCCTYTGGAKQFNEELGVLPLVPMLGMVDDDDDYDQDDEETGGGNGTQLKRHGTLAYSLALPSSMRGMPVMVKRVHTGMNPTLLRMGTMEGAVDNFALTETLQSRATAAGHMRANSIWTAATLRSRGTMDPSMTLGCGGLRKSIDTSNESFTSRYNTIADQFALESLFEESIAGSTASSTADSCDTGITGSSRTKSFKSVRSVRFIEDDFVESGLVGYSGATNNTNNTNSSIASSDVGSPRTAATDTTADSYCSWKSTWEDGTGGDASGYFSTSSKPRAGQQWRKTAATAPKRKSAMKKAQQAEASDDTASLDQDADQQQGADQQLQQQQSAEEAQQPAASPFASLQEDDEERQRGVVDAAFEVAQRDKQQQSVSSFAAAAAPPAEQQQQAASPFAAAPEPEQQQQAASPFAAAAPEPEQQQQSVSPFAAAAAPPAEQQQQAASPFAAAAAPPAEQQQQQQSVSPFAAAAAPPAEQQQQAASPFAAAAAPPAEQQQQQQSVSLFAAAAAPPAEAQQQAASPFAAASPEQQPQQATSPFAAAPPPERRAPSPFEVATALQGLQQQDDYDGDSDGGDTFTTDDDEDKPATPDVIPLQASSLSRGASMARASSVASSTRNPYCLWAVDSTPFETPAASEAAFPMDSGLSLAAKLKEADFDVFADVAETQLSKTFSDVLNSQVLQPGFLRAATHAGVVKPVLEEMLLRAATMAPETPQFFGEGMNMWRSNWLTIKATKWYMLATIFTYACNYGVFPAFVAYTIHSPALNTWYSLLLVTTYGVGDLTGKLLPIWKPRRPQATIMGIATLRLLLFFLVFAIALLLKAPPPVFFVSVFMLALSGWYESMIFSLACEGHHPQDAYQIESLLAIQLDVGIALGSVLSLAWGAGPWAIGVVGTPGPHG